MQERNLKVIEGLLFVLFILLWGLFLSGGSGKVKRRTLSLWQYIPVHTEVFHDFFENSIRKGQYELTPILGYDTYEGGKGMLLPFFRNGMQEELFPIQRFALDYWKGKEYYKAKYSDTVPDYFTESDDQSVEEKKKDPGKMKQMGTGRSYTIKELASYSFLLEHFYIVDETTSMTKQDLNGTKLVTMDLSAKLGKEEPLVLIYHTHGSETYKKVNGKEGSVIEVGTALTKELEKTLHAGDQVLLTGTIYTSRDAGHKRMCEALARGEQIPFDPTDATIYSVGRPQAKPGAVIGSAGPTTSGRMDAYAPTMMSVGARGMIGKGARLPEVVEAMKKYDGVYFGAIGGAGALLAKCIKKAELIAYEDLGAEALRKLYVEDMPLVVIIDSEGNNLYEEGRKEYLDEHKAD